MKRAPVPLEGSFSAAFLSALWTTSVVTSKAANCGQVKTGPRMLPGTWCCLELCRTAKLHGLVSMGKAVIGNQVLPDGHGIPTTTQSLLDRFAVRLQALATRSRLPVDVKSVV
jgi:hypothetical protein